MSDRSSHTAMRFVGRDRFGVLLALLLATFLFGGITDDRWPRLVTAALGLAALGVGVTSTDLLRRRALSAALAVTSVTGGSLVVVLPADHLGAGVGALGQAIVLGAILAAVVARVLRHETVTRSTLAGAIAAYIIIGLVFAWIFLALRGFTSTPAIEPPSEAMPAYYSFVVLTTLGFGDITPVTELARRLSAIEAMVGQIFLATLVARLVSMFGTRRRP